MAPFSHQTALEQILADFRCVTGTIHLLDEKTGLLTLVAQVGIPPRLLPVVQTIPVGKGIAGAAAEKRAPVEICNLQTDASGVAKPGAKQTQVQGSLAVPMMSGQALRGTLGIGKMEAYQFSEGEKARLMAVAAGLADTCSTCQSA